MTASAVVLAIAGASLTLVAPAANADGDRGRESGWSEPHSRQRWGQEFRAWGTARPILRREIRDIIRSDWAERRDADGKVTDFRRIDTGIAPVRGLDDAYLVVNGPDL